MPDGDFRTLRWLRSEHVGQCRQLAGISEDFHDEIRAECDRCKGLGGRCLGDLIAHYGTARLH